MMCISGLHIPLLPFITLLPRTHPDLGNRPRNASCRLLAMILDEESVPTGQTVSQHHANPASCCYSVTCFQSTAEQS